MSEYYSMKTYYKCELTQSAPLRISNGDNVITDSDLMLDGRGLPQIPGTSIAGVLRSMLSENEAASLFGKIITNDAERCSVESRVIISPAVLPDGAVVHITNRHGVGIGDDGTALDKSKYDFQVAETTGIYSCILEISHEKEDTAADILEKLMMRVAADGISFGARTTRGYGHMKAVIYKRTFDFADEKKNDIDKWLKFDPFDERSFSGSDVLKPQADVVGADALIINANLKMTGSFIVRVNSSKVGEADYAPLMGCMDKERTPVIPGTSWAGTFRHHMKKLALQAGACDLTKKIDEMFGYVPDGKYKRSNISFFETRIKGGGELQVTRNALDRFTMAPKKSALFTSIIWSGGEGTLTIRIKAMPDDDMMQIFYAALLDLNNGLLTFGGESSIGYGRANITELRINGEVVTDLLGVNLSAKEEETV